MILHSCSFASFTYFYAGYIIEVVESLAIYIVSLHIAVFSGRKLDWRCSTFPFFLIDADLGLRNVEIVFPLSYSCHLKIYDKRFHKMNPP